jgi:hypothetical protein
MRFVSTNDLQTMVNAEQLEQLKTQLVGTKAGNEILAWNDALLALAVYGRRQAKGEESEATVFGSRTWWLTDEVRILPFTLSLIEQRGGTRYMMRPDFLLNFIALSPNTAQIRATYARIFPSMLGIRLARRMDEKAFHELMDGMKGFEGWDEGRKVAGLHDLADRLKADFDKKYAVSLRQQ